MPPRCFRTSVAGALELLGRFGKEAGAGAWLGRATNGYRLGVFEERSFILCTALALFSAEEFVVGHRQAVQQLLQVAFLCSG
jgi:hypothetical protein